MPTRTNPPPIRATTRALAELHITISAFGTAMFQGDLDRFGIFSLLFAKTHPAAPASRPLTTNSLALSLDRPFETVRRQVQALIAMDLCHRVPAGIAVSGEVDHDPRIARLRDLSHDAFVCFVMALINSGLIAPVDVSGDRYDPRVGLSAAVDVLFAAAASNRALYKDWTGLSVFTAVLLGNAQRCEARPPDRGEGLLPRHAVRPSVVARALHMPETTIRRRLADLAAPGAQLLRVREGLLVSADWLASAPAASASLQSYQAVRLALARVAAGGFPMNDPARAFLSGPPPLPHFA